MIVEVVTHTGKIMEEAQFASMKTMKEWFRSKFKNDMIARVWYSVDDFMNGKNPDIVKGEGKKRFKSTCERGKNEQAEV